MNVKSLCVFCGSRNGILPKYIAHARKLGAMMAEKNIRLVYGGGDCGMMGAVANSVMASGGKVTGVFPKFLNQYESEHKGLTEMILVDNMHERKWTMFEHSDAFAVLPGGFGTMDETFEIITWKQLGLHKKPVILYNHDGYWESWVKLTEDIMEKGFARPETSSLYDVADDLETLFQILEDFRG